MVNTQTTVSVDKSANFKILRELELGDLVVLHAVGIEGLEDNKRLQQKELPIAIVGGEFSKIGTSKIAAARTPYEALRTEFSLQEGDALHFEAHVQSGRDVFCTEDNDFLEQREKLQAAFRTTILTPEELRELCK